MDSSKEEKLKELKENVYSREEYAKPNFWDDRYAQKEGFFDWYAQYPELSKAFNEFTLIKTDRILMVGCGNSKLSDQMYKAGYENIVNIDISPTVIQQMKDKFPYMVWQVIDATSMPYKNGQFDAIIDKGTLDALISGKNFDICHKMLQECARVTKREGQLLLITYGSPEGRRKIFQRPLPFDDYDYYYYKAALSDMSTLINLMRSNVPGKKLSSILTQKDAFAKTMKEFSIIKMMRRAKKNQRQYVVWKEFQKTNIEINPHHDEQQNLQQFKSLNTPKKQQTAQNTQKKIQQVESAEKVEQVKVIEEVKQKDFNYAPKKQAYVYVYSIRKKLAHSFQQILKGYTADQVGFKQIPQKQQATYSIEGDANLASFTLNIKNHAYECLQAVKFLEVTKTSHSKVFITSGQSNQLKNSLFVNIVPSVASSICHCFRKTNFNVIIKFNAKINAQYVINALRNIENELKTQCNLFPTPKIYELMFKLKLSKVGYSINNFLKKYWFPTWKVCQTNDKQMTLQFSISPIKDSRMKQVYNVIKDKLKLNTIEFLNLRSGFVSQYDQQLMNIINMASLSYAGIKVDVQFQEFWDQKQTDVKLKDYLIQDSEYNELRHTFSIPENILSKTIVHLLSLY